MLVYVDVVNKNCDGMKECRIINTEYVVQIRAFGAETSDGAVDVDEETCLIHLYDTCEDQGLLRVYGSLSNIANFISRGDEGLKPDAAVGSRGARNHARA